MKTITVDGKLHRYENLKALRDVFKESNIVIANHVEIGDKVVLHKDIVLETAVKIGNFCEIGQNVRIGTDSKIGRNCEIGHDVTLLTCVKIGDNSCIGNGLTIGEENTIHANTILDKSIHIVGSVATVTYTGNNRVCIGCVNYEIPYWLEHSKEIGKKWEYTDAQIKEYEDHVHQVEQWLKENN